MALFSLRDLWLEHLWIQSSTGGPWSIGSLDYLHSCVCFPYHVWPWGQRSYSLAGSEWTSSSCIHAVCTYAVSICLLYAHVHTPTQEHTTPHRNIYQELVKSIHVPSDSVNLSEILVPSVGNGLSGTHMKGCAEMGSLPVTVEHVVNVRGPTGVASSAR